MRPVVSLQERQSRSTRSLPRSPGDAGGWTFAARAGHDAASEGDIAAVRISVS